MKNGSIIFAALLLATPLFADTQDILAENPALAALQKEDPETLANVLDELAQLQALSLKRGVMLSNEKNADLIAFLKKNPALEDAYKRDPKATAKLLSVIRPQN